MSQPFPVLAILRTCHVWQNREEFGVSAAVSYLDTTLDQGDDSPPLHIVDRLIEERAPALFSHAPTRWAMRHLLYPWLGYHEAKAAADRAVSLSGPEIMDLAIRQIGMDIRTLGLIRLPPSGRLIIAANHPTGLADGVVVWNALKSVRQDLFILANSDAIRFAPGLADIFIPVEWVKNKRSPGSSRRMLADLAGVFRKEAALVIFPSGRLAYMHWRGLRERPWLSTVVTLARKFKAPILPLHIRARNSWAFYALSQVSHELRDVTLFHELLNKGGRRFELTLGLPIDPDDLPSDPAEAVSRLQHHVEHELPRASRQHPRIVRPQRPLTRIGARVA